MLFAKNSILVSPLVPAPGTKLSARAENIKLGKKLEKLLARQPWPGERRWLLANSGRQDKVLRKDQADVAFTCRLLPSLVQATQVQQTHLPSRPVSYFFPFLSHRDTAYPSAKLSTRRTWCFSEHSSHPVSSNVALRASIHLYLTSHCHNEGLVCARVFGRGSCCCPDPSRPASMRCKSQSRP